MAIQPSTRYCQIVWRFRNQEEVMDIVKDIVATQFCPFQLTFIAPGEKSRSEPLGSYGEIGIIYADPRAAPGPNNVQ